MDKLVVRSPRDDELDAFVACVGISFGIAQGTVERDRLLSGLALGDCVAVFDGTELVGALIARAVDQTLPGEVIGEAVAISDVAVLPTHRGRGAMRSMMEEAFQRVHRAGIDHALLIANDGGIYGRFGFGVGTWAARYEVALQDRQMAQQPISANATLRSLDLDEAITMLPPVFDRARVAHVGEVSRLGSWWEELLEQGSSALSQRFVVCVEDTNGIDGYVIYEYATASPEDLTPVAVLVELVATTDTAYRTLYSFLCTRESVDQLVTLERPVDEPFRHALSNHRAFKVAAIEDQLLIRIIDVVGALTKRRYGSPGSLVLEIRDGVCPWNAHTVHMVVNDNHVATIVESDEQPDLTMDIADLGALYLGGNRCRDLVRAGRIVEHAVGASTRADDIFRSAMIPFCTIGV